MTPDFASIIERWHDFYLLVGTAAATLIGLLFVGLSLNIDAIRRQTGIDLHELAAQSGNNFFYVLIIALLFLMPDQTPLGLGVPLLILAFLGLVGTIAHLRNANKLHRTWGRSSIVRRFTMPVVALVGLAVVALFLIAAETVVLSSLVLVVVVLLASATQNAWDLLIKAGDGD